MKKNLITVVMLWVMVMLTTAGMALAPVNTESGKNLPNPKQIELLMLSDEKGDMYFTYTKTHDGMLNDYYGSRVYVTEWTRIG